MHIKIAATAEVQQNSLPYDNRGMDEIMPVARPMKLSKTALASAGASLPPCLNHTFKAGGLWTEQLVWFCLTKKSIRALGAFRIQTPESRIQQSETSAILRYAQAERAQRKPSLPFRLDEAFLIRTAERTL
jgi:hypothetical protein